MKSPKAPAIQLNVISYTADCTNPEVPEVWGTFPQPLTEISSRKLKKETWGVKGSRNIGLTNLQPSVSHLFRKCGSLDLS
jgi:hypothetical protein